MQTLARDFLTLLPREVENDSMMKSARIWFGGERKLIVTARERKADLPLQDAFQITLSYTYFMVEQSLPQFSAP